MIAGAKKIVVAAEPVAELRVFGALLSLGRGQNETAPDCACYHGMDPSGLSRWPKKPANMNRMAINDDATGFVKPCVWRGFGQRIARHGGG